MKKKTLLMAVLVLAIVTSLTAGTLAVYTKTVSGGGDAVTAKHFSLAAAGLDKVTLPEIAPGDTYNYNFVISNYEKDGAPTEVNMQVDVTSDVSGILAAFPGIEVTLVGKDAKGAEVVKGELNEKNIVSFVDKTYFEATVKKDLNCTLTFAWPKDGNDAAHTAAGAADSNGSFEITVVGTQIADNSTVN